MGNLEFFGVSVLIVLFVGGGIFLSMYFFNKSFPYLRSKIKYKVLRKNYEQKNINILELCENTHNSNKLYSELLISGVRPKIARDIVFMNSEIQKQIKKKEKEQEKQESEQGEEEQEEQEDFEDFEGAESEDNENEVKGGNDTEDGRE